MTDNSNNLKFNRPPLFTPTFVRGLVLDSAQSETYTKAIGADMEDSVIGSTSSFKYDMDETGLKNTQQLKIGWDQFQNHTFFNSAQVKTNVAFDNIINKFPFDGTQKEVETFFGNLTGFEKYVFDLFPKNTGYAYFSGSLAADPNLGTWITVKDIQGAQYGQISRDTTGLSKLNPGISSTTTELWMYVPQGTNTEQTILNKITESSGLVDGFAMVLGATADTNFADGYYYVISKSIGNRVGFSVPKGQWANLAILWDRTPGVNKLHAYVDQTLTGSSDSFELGETFWEGSDLIIGSGSAFSFSSYAHTPTTTFSGALDELRLWHKQRTPEERNLYQRKNVFAQDGLKLYYKFNEPSGSNTYLTLDGSGNSLHGKLNIFGNSLGVREIPTSSLYGSSPITYEKSELNPVLFPEYELVDNVRVELLTSASNFDDNNPNLITKLIPPHYLVEGQGFQGMETELGDIATLISGSDPRSAKLGGTQLLLSLMYVWAKYFDEMKLYLQNFSNLNWVDYDDTDTTPDQFLQFLAKQQGFQLPPLFTGTSIEQYINSENIQDNISTNSMSLQYIQNQIWRRILINLQDIVRSKGTLHSVKSFIRSVGIDPDNNFRIREFGGPNRAPLNFVRDKRSEVSSMVDFVSGGLLTSQYLSGTRVEPGYPVVSSEVSAANGYFTSGSWTYEATYRFPIKYGTSDSQSLARFLTTGSQTATSGALLGNIVAISSSQTVNFYGRPNQSPSAPFIALTVTGANLFDGNKWYVSVGRQRADDTGMNSLVSASYFLRVAQQNHGDIVESHFNTVFFNEASGTTHLCNMWSQTTSSMNSSGSFFVIGSGTVGDNAGVFVDSCLNDVTLPETTKETRFQGRVGQIRFWSKYLNDQEWSEHVRNFKSVGVQDPTKNFNFVTAMSGSFERLRTDISTDQIVTGTNVSGEIQAFDFTQNNFHLSGTLFPTSSLVVVPEKYYYSYISPKFDEGTSVDKVRPRSFLNYQNVVSNSYSQVAPLYQIELSEQPTDNTRFTIDFSVVDALDQDMVGIFSTLDSLDNILGNPELLFSPDYPQLDVLRDVYFNRLTDKINLKGFFEFYKWFDTNIGVFISQLIPRKTKYLGTNFVIESHMLERPKMEYQYSDIYLGDSNRHGLKDTILLQLITGEIKRI